MIISENIRFFGITPYLFWALLGCFAALDIFSYFVIKEGMKLKLPLFLFFSSFLGMITGARIFALIAEKIYFENTGNIVHGGMVFYGGLAGFLVVFFMLQKICVGSQIIALWDFAAVTVPLFHAFGRIGCAFSGCCYGTECQKIFVEYSDGIKRFPIQFLGSVFEFVMFFVLFILVVRNRKKGLLMKIYLTVYPIGRFVAEFFRGDEVRGFIGYFSFGQICSIFLLILMIIINIWNYYKKKV